jgi:hypothetical protein
MLRKIKTQEEINKSKRKKQIVIGGGLILIMLLSIAGYGFFNRETSDSGVQTGRYGEYVFVKNGDFWVLSAGNQNFYFKYLPQETGNVSVNLNLTLNEYSNKPLYFVNDTGFSQEILMNIQRYVLRSQEACIENCTDFPMKTCSDNLVIFTGVENTSVVQNQNCVYLSGDLLRASDAFLYKILGIK